MPFLNDTVAQHKPFSVCSVSETLLRVFLTKDSGSPLSARERSVVQLNAESHSNKKIATILGLSVKTDGRHEQTLGIGF